VTLGVQIMMFFLISMHTLHMTSRTQGTVRRRHLTIGLFGIAMMALIAIQVAYPLLPFYAMGYMLGTCLLHSFVLEDEKEEYRQGLKEATKVAELRQSIASLLDNMPAMSFSKDVETGAYLACNQSFAAFANKRTPAGVVGLTDHDLFDPKTASHFVKDDQRALGMDRPLVFYEDVVDAVGEPRRFKTTKLKFNDSNGRECLLGMSLDVTEAEQTKEAYRQELSARATYENIVDALSGDYFNLFYVDLDTDEYIEYGLRTEAGHRGSERHGTDFFTSTVKEIKALVYEEDQESLLRAMEKETLVREVSKNGTFIIQYRLMINGEPTYVNLKASRVAGDSRHLTIGVNNVDAQVKDRAAAMRATEDLKSYRRLTALSGNLMVLYYVNLENDYYTEFGATKDYDELGIAKQGYEFFRTTHKNSLRAVHPDDLELFQSQVTKENILRTIDRDGMFALDYRLVRGDRSTYVRLKAARLQEDGKQILIIGILDEDARVRREQEVERSLSDAQRMATVDALTGVKNKRAYAQWEEKINAAIGSGEQEPFAVVVCDINDMKYVNDLYGHKEGDACLKRTSKRICDAFDHSPVFRVGGDEFVALLMGEDYDRREELVESVNELPRDLTSVRPGDTLSAGMVEYDKDAHHSLLSVFEAADQAMYERKQRVKSMLATVGYSSPR
jgi:diguanylate cyclase (GGDEF)-like protein